MHVPSDRDMDQATNYLGVRTTVVLGDTYNVTLACTRQEPAQIDCTLRESTWLGQRSQKIERNQVQDIRIQTTDCTKSIYNSSRNQWQNEASSCDQTLLQTRASKVYIALSSTAYSPLSAFIHSAQSTLTVIDSHWLFASILVFFG